MEYIERDAVKEAAWEGFINRLVEDQGMYGYLVSLVNEVFDAIPAADVVPVRHGRWRKAVGTSGVVRMACTNCGFMRSQENDSREPMFAYCPRCGALMDKDGDGE
jgi:hypothetical protein